MLGLLHMSTHVFHEWLTVTFNKLCCFVLCFRCILVCMQCSSVFLCCVFFCVCVLRFVVFYFVNVSLCHVVFC